MISGAAPAGIQNKSLNLTIIGTGYVGLVSGVCFAAMGHRVTCIDNDPAKIDTLRQGRVPIYEPGLEALMHEAVHAGRLHFSDDLATGMADCDAVFIAVGTPTAPDGISADLTAIHQVARSLAPLLKKPALVVTKSTVPVLTNKAIETLIYETNPQASFDICSNPEFLREGNAISDFMKPDRIVIGVRNARAGQIMAQIYAPLTAQNFPLIQTSPESAELIKYAANAFLATKVAFINEVANLAEAMDADISDIAYGIGMDSRIGLKFLQPGPGYGGSCFPKDTRAFAHTARQNGMPSRIIEAVIDSNTRRKHEMAGRIAAIMTGSIKGRKIAVLGVTFKADTDDMRESVSLDIIPKLILDGAVVHAYDPAANQHVRAALPPEVQWHDTAMAAVKDADALVILTEWPEFKALDLAAASKAMRQPRLIDLRNLYHPQAAVDANFEYHSIGRKAKKDPDFNLNQTQQATGT